MSAPIILPWQGILYFVQHGAVSFQPGLSASGGAATSWAADGLPPGVTINSGTGLVSGPVTLFGQYPFRVTATNDDGESVQEFVMAIEATASTPTPDVELVWDLNTNRVSADVPPPLAGGSVSPGDVVAAVLALPDKKARRAAAIAAAVARMKVNSDLIIRPRLVKRGAPVILPVTKFGWNLKEFETDAALDSSDKYLKTGSGADTVYRIWGKPDAAALKAAVSDHATASGAEVALRCVLYMTYTNPDAAVVPTDPATEFFAGATLTQESLPFYVAVAAEQKES